MEPLNRPVGLLSPGRGPAGVERKVPKGRRRPHQDVKRILKLSAHKVHKTRPITAALGRLEYYTANGKMRGNGIIYDLIFGNSRNRGEHEMRSHEQDKMVDFSKVIKNFQVQ